jgi:hypothetical protein
MGQALHGRHEAVDAIREIRKRRLPSEMSHSAPRAYDGTPEQTHSRDMP